MLSRKCEEDEDTSSRLSSGGSHWLGWGGCFPYGDYTHLSSIICSRPSPFLFSLFIFIFSFAAAEEITAALNLHNTRFGRKKCESENVQIYTLECAMNSAHGHTKQYKLWNFFQNQFVKLSQVICESDIYSLSKSDVVNILKYWKELSLMEVIRMKFVKLLGEGEKFLMEN